MFCKNWTKKEWLKCLLCFVIYFAGIILVELPGFGSALYWVLCPIAAAFVAAGPAACVLNMSEGRGAALILPLVWFVLMKLTGEFTMWLMMAGILCMILVSEIVWNAAGAVGRKAVRAAIIPMSLIPFMSFLPLYFQTALYSANAAEEMGMEYSQKLAGYGNAGMFLLVLILSIAAGIGSERLSEKMLGMQEVKKETFLHN